MSYHAMVKTSPRPRNAAAAPFAGIAVVGMREADAANSGEPGADSSSRIIVVLDLEHPHGHVGENRAEGGIELPQQAFGRLPCLFLAADMTELHHVER